MSLKLHLKESLFKILDLLPEKQGYFFYHKIQSAMNGDNMLQRVESNEGSYRVLLKMLQQIGFSIKGKNILEIGSGWSPVMPYFLLFSGEARSVVTFDLNRHFSEKNINRLNEIFESEYGIKPPSGITGSYRLPKEITYHANTNLINAELPEADLVFSRFVLEHVTPRDIALMHEKFKRDLKPGSIIVHLISPGDHRAYIDKNLSLQDFLQYSEIEWQKKQSKFDYHNRLRLPQYLNIFKASGVDILDVKFDCPSPDSPAFKKFKAVQLHEEFEKFSDAEVTAGSINIILKT